MLLLPVVRRLAKEPVFCHRIIGSKLGLLEYLYCTTLRLNAHSPHVYLDLAFLQALTAPLGGILCFYG
jgi:hypothetical protein